MNRDSNPDLCDAGAVLHQLSYQANWEQIVMWVDYKPLDVEIDVDNTRTCTWSAERHEWVWSSVSITVQVWIFKAFLAAA